MIIEFQGKKPGIADGVFIAENSTVIGDVTIESDASIWYGAVLRGDIDSIKIGKRSNIQDLSVIHVDKGKPTFVGEDVTVGHGAILHGCHIEDCCLIGMGAIILDGAEIGTGTIVAAGALVPPDKKIGPHKLVAGIPAKTVRTLSEKDFEELKHHAGSYAEYAKMHNEI